MSHSRSRARGKSSGKHDRARPSIGKQPVAQDRKYSRVGVFSTLLAIGIVVVLVLGFALMAIIGHGNSTAAASEGGPTSSSAPGYGSLNHPKGSCGNDGQPSCPAVDPGWFPVGAESPGAVVAAITGGSEFATIARQYGIASLDTPALVHAYGAHTGMDYYDDDHWVVSVRDSTGMRCGLFDFVYDRMHQRMRFSSYGVLTAQDPHSRLAFPYLSPSMALTRLQSQRRLSMMVGQKPELIFFPIDPSFPNLNSPVHKWAGGGNSAMDPMWHVVGADRHDYFVGGDLNVYAQPDLPMAKGQP